MAGHIVNLDKDGREGADSPVDWLAATAAIPGAAHTSTPAPLAHRGSALGFRQQYRVGGRGQRPGQHLRGDPRLRLWLQRKGQDVSTRS